MNGEPNKSLTLPTDSVHFVCSNRCVCLCVCMCLCVCVSPSTHPANMISGPGAACQAAERCFSHYNEFNKKNASHFFALRLPSLIFPSAR